ncbi:hypothetical protein H0H87_004112 [Tephrocybe sp. NHM501043]|nr:hypothetical protein H0H87_004112 [Tephrocybe sp. NHM501043]
MDEVPECTPNINLPRPLSRPTLLQALTHAQSATGSMSDTVLPPGTSELPFNHSLVHTASHSDNPASRISAETVSRPGAFSSAHVDLANATIITEPTIRTPTLIPAPSSTNITSTYRGSSYALVKALRDRVITSLSDTHPPNKNDTLLLFQAANSHAVNALTAARHSYTLAQQSLATAKEAVCAAQECLRASEQAKIEVSDALAAVKELNSSIANIDSDGHAQWRLEAKIKQSLDDLRLLGEWIEEKENQEAVKRQDANRLVSRIQNRSVVESAIGAMGASGLDPLVVQAMISELVKRVTDKQAGDAGAPPAPYTLDLDSNLQRSAEVEKDVQQEHITNTGGTLMDVHDDLAEHLPPEASRDGPISASSNRQTGASSKRSVSSTLDQRSLSRAQEDEARLQALREEETRIRELQERKLEVAKFQMMQQASEELPGSTTHDLPPTAQNSNAVTTGQSSQPRYKGSPIVEDAKRALQMHKDKEAALVAQLARKKVETRRLLEEKKERELADLRKKEEEKMAELERLTTVKEQELIAEQGRRRQEVMAQKLRASAETAAKIIAERARERERHLAISAHSPISAASQMPAADNNVASGNSAMKKTTSSEAIKKPKSGQANDGQPEAATIPDSLPPVLVPSAALGLRPSNYGLSPTKTSPECKPSRLRCERAAPIERSLSQKASLVESRTPTFSRDRNSVEALHVYRRSEDPGDMRVVPQSQIQPTSSEVQATNLRYVRDGNGARLESMLTHDIKTESEHTDRSHVNGGPTVKRESPPPVPLGKPDTTPAPGKQVDTIPSGTNALPTPMIPLPVKPCPLPLVSPVQKAASKEDQGGGLTNGSRGAKPTSTSAAATLSSSVSPPAVSATIVLSAAPMQKSATLKRPPLSLTPNPHHNKTGLPPRFENNIKAQSGSAPSSSNLLAIPLPTGSPLEDVSQIAPMIHSDSGWDQAVDEEPYETGFPIQETIPPRPPKQLRRGADHYSPPSRPTILTSHLDYSYLPRPDSPISRSPLTPAPRSPVLGKRRHREDYREDEPSARRLRPMDGMRVRSPPTSPRQRRPASPKRPPSTNLHARLQPGDPIDIPRARNRELVWRSPSPDLPTLQARIGTRDSATYQSYRPNHDTTETYNRPQSRNHPESYRPRQGGFSYRQSMDGRFPSEQYQASSSEPRPYSYNRGRGSMHNSNGQGTSRGRGGRGGTRPLNLEQRISHKPMTLMYRLESPSRNL